MYTIRFNVHPQGLIQDFSLEGGGGEILASDSISGIVLSVSCVCVLVF